ncbi:MAG: acetylornithine deacetylase [Alphaproteobacteria bacterium]
MTGQVYTVRQMIDRLISFDTTSRNSNLNLIHWVRDYLAGHGVTAALMHDDSGKKASLFATLGPSGDGGIVLSGHSDVVPVDGQDWSSDPWSVVERDGRLYGRGTSDMKSFSAITLALVPEFLVRGLITPIHIALSYDEEVGCLGVHGLLDHLRDGGLRPRAVIIGEPTEMKVVNAHKTGVQLRTTVRGRAFHSSMPQKGLNAIVYGAELVTELARLAEVFADMAPNERFDPPYSTLSVNLIDGGTATNIIPSECILKWEMRLLPGVSAEAVAADFRQFAQEQVLPRMRAVWAGADIETELLGQVPGLIPEDGSDAETLALALTESNQTYTVPYGTEAGLFQQFGVPTVVCGPGSIEQAHTPDEFIALSEVAACERFMQRLMDRVCEH